MPQKPQSQGAKFADLIMGQAGRGYQQPQQTELERIRIENMRSLIEQRQQPEQEPQLTPYQLLVEERRKRTELEAKIEKAKTKKAEDRIINLWLSGTAISEDTPAPTTREGAEQGLILQGKDPEEYRTLIDQYFPVADTTGDVGQVPWYSKTPASVALGFLRGGGTQAQAKPKKKKQGRFVVKEK